MNAVGTNVEMKSIFGPSGCTEQGNSGTLMKHIQTVYQVGPNGILIRQRTTIEQVFSSPMNEEKK